MAGTGQWICSRRRGSACIWRTRQATTGATVGSRTTSGTLGTWRTCCGWVASRRPGSHRRRCGGARAGPLSGQAGPAPLGPEGSGARGDGQRGVAARLDDMFGPGGQRQLDEMQLGDVYVVRIESLRDLIEVYDREVAMLERKIHQMLRGDRGYQTIQALHGVGRTMAAIFVAEIGDVHRFRSAEALCSWAGLAPRHRESDAKVVRGAITKMGSRRRRQGRSSSPPAAGAPPGPRRLRWRAPAPTTPPSISPHPSANNTTTT